MNEFTKEELRDIGFCLRNMQIQGSCDSTWNADIRALIIKVESMIDNYCEHTAKSFECRECGSWACKVCQNRMVENE